MPDRLLIPAKKRKRINGVQSDEKAINGHKARRLMRRKDDDEELDLSGSEASERVPSLGSGLDESSDDGEDVDEKRRRLAKEYLAELTANAQLEGQDYDALELDRDIIAERLSKDASQKSSKFHLHIADTLDIAQAEADFALPLVKRKHSRFFARPQTTFTSAVVDPQGRFCYAAAKDSRICKINFKTGRMLTVLKARLDTAEIDPGEGNNSSKAKGKARDDQGRLGHQGAILCLAISSDGRYLASGGQDGRIGIWNLDKKCWVGALGGHKGQVTGLGFRLGTHDLYSASSDRTVKIWNVSPPVLSYVDTLFGHQDAIADLKVLSTEVCVTAGSRDKTSRYWKILEESQLVFRGGQKSRVREVMDDPGLLTYDAMHQDLDGSAHVKMREVGEAYIEGSVDCVAMIDDSHFLSGGDSGAISLWHTGKKKAVFTFALAHGLDRHVDAGDGVGGPGGSIEKPRWITALATAPLSDLFVSGSWDGQLRLWQLDASLRAFRPLMTLPIHGIINSLHIVHHELPHSAEQQHQVLLVAAVGREPRLGRWYTSAGSKNGTLLINLPRKGVPTGHPPSRPALISKGPP